MRVLCSLLCFCLLALALPAQGATLAEPQVGYTAERTLVLNGRSYVGKIWAMPGKERHEQVIQGFEPVFLLSDDSPVGRVVLAKLKTIVEFVMPAELRLLRKGLKRTPVGRETVNGVGTTKYAIDEDVPEGHAEGTLWLSGNGIPMKLAGTLTGAKGKVATVLWELRHVSIGPQPAALFEAPHGLSKLPAEAIAPLLGMRLKSAKAQ